MSETYWIRPRTKPSPRPQITSASSPCSPIAARSAAYLRARSRSELMWLKVVGRNCRWPSALVSILLLPSSIVASLRLRHLSQLRLGTCGEQCQRLLRRLGNDEAAVSHTLDCVVMRLWRGGTARVLDQRDAEAAVRGVTRRELDATIRDQARKDEVADAQVP